MIHALQCLARLRLTTFPANLQAKVIGFMSHESPEIRENALPVLVDVSVRHDCHEITEDSLRRIIDFLNSEDELLQQNAIIFLGNISSYAMTTQLSQLHVVAKSVALLQQTSNKEIQRKCLYTICNIAADHSEAIRQISSEGLKKIISLKSEWDVSSREIRWIYWILFLISEVETKTFCIESLMPFLNRCIEEGKWQKNEFAWNELLLTMHNVVRQYRDVTDLVTEKALSQVWRSLEMISPSSSDLKVGAINFIAACAYRRKVKEKIGYNLTILLRFLPPQIPFFTENLIVAIGNIMSLPEAVSYLSDDQCKQILIMAPRNCTSE